MTAISLRKQGAIVCVPTIAAMALALAACGGASTGGTSASTPCVATLTGVTATNTCSSQAIGSGGAWSLTIGTTANAAAGFGVDLSIDGTGTMATGTYTLGATMTGGIGVSEGSKTFNAEYQTAAGGNIPLTGTATLTITSFTSVSGQTSVLFPHGTLTASCPPSPADAGTSGPAAISVTF